MKQCLCLVFPLSSRLRQCLSLRTSRVGLVVAPTACIRWVGEARAIPLGYNVMVVPFLVLAAAGPCETSLHSPTTSASLSAGRSSPPLLPLPAAAASLLSASLLHQVCRVRVWLILGCRHAAHGVMPDAGRGGRARTGLARRVPGASCCVGRDATRYCRPGRAAAVQVTRTAQLRPLHSPPVLCNCKLTCAMAATVSTAAHVSSLVSSRRKHRCTGSDGVSTNATVCEVAIRNTPSGYVNGLSWDTPLWCKALVLLAPAIYCEFFGLRLALLPPAAGSAHRRGGHCAPH